LRFIVEKIFVKSEQSTELIRITDQVRRAVEMSGLKTRPPRPTPADMMPMAMPRFS